jgi:Mechanosensitive ion channel, conserved TM helix
MWQTLAAAMDESWRQLAVEFAHLLPNVLASLVIFTVGAVAGVVVGAVARRALVAAKVDRGAARIGLADPLERMGISSTARLIAVALKWATIAAAFIPALYTLDPRVASDLVTRSLVYLPHLAVAVVILWVGTALSRFLARGVLIAAVNHGVSSPRLLAGATRVGVVLVAVAVALEHVGIGRATVLTAFAILFGGVTLAAALAVGLGSQDAVRAWLAGRTQAKPAAKEEAPFRHW